MKNKDICIIIPSLAIGGAEKILINLLCLIDRDQFRINLFVGFEVKNSLVTLLPAGVNMRYVFPNKFIARMAAFVYRRTGSTLLLRYYGRKITGIYDFGLSFLDGPFSEFLFINHCKIIKGRGVVLHSSYKSFHNMKKVIETAHYDRMKNRYVNVDVIIAVSNEVKSEFQVTFPGLKHVKVLYNPINSAEILRLSSEPCPALSHVNEFKIVAVGNLVAVKGFERLIGAASILKSEGYVFKLYIVGEGPLRGELQEMINKKRLEDYIELCGFQKNPYPYILAADLFAMSSYTEGLPTALCEAMILDKPVLVPDVTGCREIVNYGEFGLMTESNEQSIAEGVKRLLNDRGLLALYARQAAKRKAIFDDEMAVSAYAELFRGHVSNEQTAVKVI